MPSVDFVNSKYFATRFTKNSKTADLDVLHPEKRSNFVTNSTISAPFQTLDTKETNPNRSLQSAILHKNNISYYMIDGDFDI